MDGIQTAWIQAPTSNQLELAAGGTEPLCASTFSWVKWGNHRTYLLGLPRGLKERNHAKLLHVLGSRVSQWPPWLDIPLGNRIQRDESYTEPSAVRQEDGQVNKSWQVPRDECKDRTELEL